MEQETVKIIFTGDFCPHLRIEKLAIENDYNSVFNEFKKEFENNDLNVIDLECPLTSENIGIDKSGPHQKAHPKTIELLKEINVGLAVMANNHILDYGENGLKETIELCDKKDISHLGVGNNIEEAGKPLIKKIKGKRIAFFNVTESEWSIAEKDKPGANPIDIIDNYKAIQNLNDKVDKIIVIAHGGIEHYHLPSPRIKKTYRFFVDAGADAVISHHTHCFTGYEIYNDAPIFYGLGNFIYDWPSKENENWNFGFIVRLLINKSIDFEIIPLKQNNGNQVGVYYLNNEEKQQFERRINKLNSIITDDIELENEFLKLVEKKINIYRLYFEPYRGKLLSALRIRKLLPDLFTKRKKLAQLDIVRCESHRDIFLEAMKHSIQNKD